MNNTNNNNNNNKKDNKSNISSITDPILTQLLMEGYWDKTTTKTTTSSLLSSTTTTQKQQQQQQIHLSYYCPNFDQKKGDLFCDLYLRQIKPKSHEYIFYWKDGIHSSVCSTKIFLYHIREPKYKQNNMGYQISRITKYEESKIFKSNTNLIFAYFL